MKRWLLLALALACALSTPTWAGFDEGVAAYDRGDYETAFREFKAAAEKGHADAQYKLGTKYRQGQNVPQDYAEAVKWYRRAAEQGHTEAQFFFGIMYDNGEGVVQDVGAAAKWYRKAAEQGDAWAQSNLGLMYYKGQGVSRDYVQAHMWWSLAAAKGKYLMSSLDAVDGSHPPVSQCAKLRLH